MDPLVSTLDVCLDYLDAVEPPTPLLVEPVEYELPRNLLERDGNNALLECAAVWSTFGRERFHDILDILSHHELAGRVAVNRMADNHQLYMEHFNPRTWGEPRSFEGRPISELPDKRFGRWAETSLSKDYLINRPRLLACRVPMATAFGDYVVPYTTLRLPCGKTNDAPDHVIAITRLEPSPYKTAQEASGVHPRSDPPRPRSGHLRLVKS